MNTQIQKQLKSKADRKKQKMSNHHEKDNNLAAKYGFSKKNLGTSAEHWKTAGNAGHFLI